MTAVASQPTIFRPGCSLKSPMIVVLLASSIIMPMTGTATTPLMTALQNKAFIGLIGEYWIARPASTLTAMMP